MVIKTDPENKFYWVHIRRVSFNAGTQLIKTRNQFRDLISSGTLEHGWHLVGVTHLLADGGNLLLTILKNMTAISDSDIKEYQNSNVNALLNGEETVLPVHLNPPMVLGAAMRTLVLSPKFLAEYVVNGKLPNLGWAQFPTDALLPNQNP